MAATRVEEESSVKSAIPLSGECRKTRAVRLSAILGHAHPETVATVDEAVARLRYGFTPKVSSPIVRSRNGGSAVPIGSLRRSEASSGCSGPDFRVVRLPRRHASASR